MASKALLANGVEQGAAVPMANAKDALLAVNPVPVERQLNAADVATLAFFLTCAGPYGIEVAVRAGGARLTLIGLCCMPLLWAAPQGLFTAEMSCMFDQSNGGYVVWVREGLGAFLGFLNAWTSLVATAVDTATYLVLVSDYAARYTAGAAVVFDDDGGAKTEQLSFGVRFALQWAVVAIFFLLNVRKIDTLARFERMLAILVTTPFAVLFVVVAARATSAARACGGLSTAAWSRGVGQGQTPKLGLWMSSMMWNWMGWDALGAVAAEVRDPHRSYPQGVLITAFINLAVYLLALLPTLSLQPNADTWRNGELAVVAAQAADWIGVAVLTGGVAAGCGLYSATLASAARALWAMAGGGDGDEEAARARAMLPTCVAPTLRRLHSRFGTPHIALAALSLTSGAIGLLDFDALVEIDILFSSLSIVFEVAAFAVLRKREPCRRRPFKVPGGWAGVVMIVLLNGGIAVLTWALLSWKTWAIGASCEALFALAYFVALKQR